MTEETQKLLNQAKALDAFGRSGKAIPLLNRALALTPWDADLLCQVAKAYFDEEQWEECLQAAEKALSVKPHSEWAHRLRCVSLRHLSRLPEALQAAHDATRYSPNGTFALFTLGETLRECGDYKRAEAIGLRLLTLAPEEVLTHQLLCNVYTSTCRWPDVERHARLGLQCDAEKAALHRLLGKALSRQGCKSEALQAYLNALRLEPTSETAQSALHEECLRFEANPILREALMIGMFLLAALLYSAHWSALAALSVSGLAVVCLLVALMRFAPAAFLWTQWEYRKLPPPMRGLVARQFRDDWLKSSGGFASLVITTFLMGGFLFLLTRF
jgi:tetratricopeptide (TPR) repeat protein